MNTRDLSSALATLFSELVDGEAGVNGLIGSIAHLAYHLGAIRQVDRAVRGPSATD